MEAFLSCEAGAGASIRPSKAPSSLGKASQKSCPFAAPGWLFVVRNLAVVRNQPSFHKTLPVLAFDSRAQGFNTPLSRRRSIYPPSSPNLVPTYPAVHAATRLRVLRHPIRLSTTVIIPSLPLACHTLSKDTILGFGRDAPGETVLTQPRCHRLATNRLSWVDSPVGVTSQG